MQLTLGIIVCMFSIQAYHHYQPYEAWQNDLLQQACQFSIFFTLLTQIITRANDASELYDEPISPIDKAWSQHVMGWILALSTVASTLSAIPMAFFEVFPNSEESARRAKLRYRRMRRRVSEVSAPARDSARQRMPKLDRQSCRARLSRGDSEHGGDNQSRISWLQRYGSKIGLLRPPCEIGISKNGSHRSVLTALSTFKPARPAHVVDCELHKHHGSTVEKAYARARVNVAQHAMHGALPAHREADKRAQARACDLYRACGPGRSSDT